MPGLQLPISVAVSAIGVETFNSVQAAIAGVAGTAQTQAAAGLRALTESLGESSFAANKLNIPMMSLLSSMEFFGTSSGDLLPQDLGVMAQAMERVRAETVRGTQALQDINIASAGYETVLKFLTAEERAFVEALAIGSKSVLSWSEQLWRAEQAGARLTSGMGKMAGASVASVETLNRVQAALAGVGWTAKEQAAGGLYALSLSLQEMSAAAGAASPSMRFLAVMMDSVVTSGETTPAVLGQVAQVMETVRASTLRNALALQNIDVASLNYKDALKLLTAEEQTFIKTLEMGSRMLLGWSNQLQRTEQASAQLVGKTRETAKATDALSVRSRRMSGAMGAFSSTAQGLMLTFSALSGSIKGTLFSLIFLGYGMVPVTIAVAALGIVVGGLTKAITASGRAVEQLRLKLDLLGGSLKEGYAAWQQTLYWSVRTGRSFEEVSETLRTLRENGVLFQGAIEAAFSLAAARGITAAEAAKLYATAIGEEQENLESLRTVGVRVNRDLIDATDRHTVANVAALAILERYPDAYQRLASTGTGALGRIKMATSAAWSLLAEPIWKAVFVPLLNSLADAAYALVGLVDRTKRSKAVMESWAKTFALATNTVGDLNAVFREHSNLLNLVVKGAILAVLGAVRFLIVAGKVLFGVLLGLGKVLVYLARSLKPVWDSLRMLAGALKEIGFMGFLTEAKKWSLDFPGVIWTGLAAAMGYLALGKEGLLIILASLMGDLIIEMLPFEDDVRETMHQVWDWMIIGGAIGLFFGAGGVAIGLGVGMLLGLLDKEMGNPIRTWLETNLPYIFHWLIIGGAIGAFFGAGGIAIGIGTGILIGWLDSIFEYQITSWLVEHMPHIFPSALIGAAIGFLFGFTPVGVAIGAGVGALIGWLGTLFEIPVKEWLLDRLPKIFMPTLIAGVIGFFLGGGPVGAAIGAGIGAILGMLSAFFPEIRAWGHQLKLTFLKVYQEILEVLTVTLGPLLGIAFEGPLQRVRQTIANFEMELSKQKVGEGVKQAAEKAMAVTAGGFAETMRSGMADYQAEFEAMMAEFAPGFAPGLAPAGAPAVKDLAESMREMAGYQAEYEALMAKLVGAAAPAGALLGPRLALAGQAALATPLQPVVNVDVSGNYILDDVTATRLADEIGEKIMAQLSNRWPITMP